MEDDLSDSRPQGHEEIAQTAQGSQEKNAGAEKGVLASLISEQFTAGTDFRNLNFTVPQST